MGVIGKWGITRDPDGALAFIIEWPWYWRYPCGIAIAIGTAWMLSNLKGEWGFAHWIVLGMGGILAMSTMYELLLLGIWCAAFAGIWWVIGLVIPDETLKSILSKPAAALVLIVILWWQLWETRRRLADAERTIKHLASVIDYNRQSETDSRESVYDKLAALADRVHALEEPFDNTGWR